MVKPFGSKNDSHIVIDYYHYHYNKKSKGDRCKADGGFAVASVTRSGAKDCWLFDRWSSYE